MKPKPEPNTSTPHSLRRVGGVVDGSRIRREYPITLGRIEGHGRRGKALKADYVLEYRNTKLATVEAKAWNEALTEGVGQAKDYATKLAVRWAYSTNGHGIYQIDMGENSHGSYGIDTRYGIGESHESHSSHHSHSREREIAQYSTPDELCSKTFAEQNAWRDRFAAVPFEDRGGYFQGRYYQDIAIERVLESLAAEGFGHDQLAEMQRIIDADKSDLFDVLAHVAYALPTVTREVRAANARVHIHSEFNEKQQASFDFVLAHYVSEGVEELDQKKLTPLLRLKYHDSLSDAVADLGKPEEIGKVFAGFQKYLYQGGA